MSLTKSREMREKRAALANQANEILAKPEGENGALSAEQRTKFDAIMADVDAMKQDIDRVEASERIQAELGESRGVVAGRADTAEGRAAEVEDRQKKHEAAFRDYLLNGEAEMSPESRAVMREFRAQSVGTTTAGGYLVPEGFSNALEESMLEFGGMREAATVFGTASGNDLPWPTVDDTAQKGAILAENTAVAEQDFTFGQIVFKAYKYSSKLVKVSVELLQDSAFDLNAYLVGALGTRLARITNEHFTTGTNSAQPQGVVTGSSVGKTGATGQTTTIIYDDIVDLLHSVDPAYRRSPKAAFMCSDSMIKVIHKLKDANNLPLWEPSIKVGEPDSILGKRVIVNQDVAAPAASAKSLLFGDFSKYMIRDVKGVTVLRLNERYADAHQVGFLAFMRADGRILDAGTDPIKHYANSAT